MKNQLSPAACSQVPEMPARSRRRHPRYACEGHAEVFVPHGALLFRGKILDLSLSGCFIETPAMNLERGTHVEVYFDMRQIQIRVAGHIAVLHRRRGAGIAFQNMSARLSRQVSELVLELEGIAERERVSSQPSA